jgi:hypothetical protein
MDLTAKYTVKRATITEAADGTVELVAAVTGKSIRIIALHIASVVSGAWYLQDDAGTPVELIGGAATDILHSTNGAVGDYSFTLPWNPDGWAQTTKGQALDCVLTGDIAGCITYCEV